MTSPFPAGTRTYSTTPELLGWKQARDAIGRWGRGTNPAAKSAAVSAQHTIDRADKAYRDATAPITDAERAHSRVNEPGYSPWDDPAVLDSIANGKTPTPPPLPVADINRIRQGTSDVVRDINARPTPPRPWSMNDPDPNMDPSDFESSYADGYGPGSDPAATARYEKAQAAGDAARRAANPANGMARPGVTPSPPPPPPPSRPLPLVSDINRIRSTTSDLVRDVNRRLPRPPIAAAQTGRMTSPHQQGGTRAYHSTDPVGRVDGTITFGAQHDMKFKPFVKQPPKKDADGKVVKDDPKDKGKWWTKRKKKASAEQAALCWQLLIEMSDRGEAITPITLGAIEDSVVGVEQTN
jgi:hypothetical protein